MTEHDDDGVPLLAAEAETRTRVYAAINRRLARYPIGLPGTTVERYRVDLSRVASELQEAVLAENPDLASPRGVSWHLEADWVHGPRVPHIHVTVCLHPLKSGDLS